MLIFSLFRLSWSQRRALMISSGTQMLMLFMFIDDYIESKFLISVSAWCNDSDFIMIKWLILLSIIKKLMKCESLNLDLNGIVRKSVSM